MSSNESDSNKNLVTRLSIYIGLGIGFSGELAGMAFAGWYVGKYWINSENPQMVSGLGAAAGILVAIVHISWILLKLSKKNEEEGL